MRSRSPSVCLLTTFAVSATAALLSGCTNHEFTEVAPVATSEEQLIFPAEPRKKVDLLFVIDDSKSMKEEQDRLIAAFDEMLRPLQELPAGPGGHRSGTVVELTVSEGGTPPQPQFRVSLAATDPAPDA